MTMISFINGKQLNSMKCVIVRYDRTLLFVGYNVHPVPSTLSRALEFCSTGLKEEYYRCMGSGILAKLTCI